MRLHDVLTITQAHLFSSEANLEVEVCSGFGADLMSDVLRYEVAQALLVTGLVNPQIVRTAEMGDAAAILMVRGNVPLPETIALARQVGIPILGTQFTMFETCGRLYAAGLPAARRHDDLI
jgi:predicted transcriptional regulator